MTEATRFAVVYSVVTGQIRSIVVPDVDEELRQLRTQMDEAVLVLNRSEITDVPALQSLVKQRTGIGA